MSQWNTVLKKKKVWKLSWADLCIVQIGQFVLLGCSFISLLSALEWARYLWIVERSKNVEFWLSLVCRNLGSCSALKESKIGNQKCYEYDSCSDSDMELHSVERNSNKMGEWMYSQSFLFRQSSYVI